MRIINTAVFFIVTPMVIRCALQAPPSGGPVDRTPPAIVEVFPPRDTTEVPPSSIISITFDESVDRYSFEQSISISPRQGVPPAFEWDDKSVRVIPAEEFRDNTTYVISLGTTLKDLRNNSLERPLQWAFSTGDVLDEGSIVGQVLKDRIPIQAGVWAYRITEPDTMRPAVSYADYMSSSDKNGYFRLTNMPPGKYSVFAVIDRNLNQLYEIGSDEIGISAAATRLAPDSGQPFIWLQVVREDTTKPEILDADAPDARHVNIRFTEPVLTAKGFSSASVSISSGNESLRVQGFARFSDSKNVLSLSVEDLNQEMRYSIRIRDIRDESGNYISSSGDTISFIGSSAADTVRPSISAIFPSDTLQKIMPEEQFRLEFSEIMDTLSVNNAITIIQPGDDTPVSFVPLWTDGSTVTAVPKNHLIPGSGYQLRLAVSQIHDLAANSLIDSVFSRIFMVLDSASSGTVKGRIHFNNINTNNNLYLNLVSSKERNVIKKLALSGPGDFVLHSIAAGSYFLEAFWDEDGNGVFSPGSTHPFKACERYSRYAGNLDVRPGWDIEGADISFELTAERGQ